MGFFRAYVSLGRKSLWALVQVQMEMYSKDFCLFGPQKHGHGTAFHFRGLFHSCKFIGLVSYLFKQRPASVCHCNFPSPEHDSHFNLVFFADEFFNVAQLDFKIMGIGFRPDLDFFVLESLLLFSGFLQLFVLLVAISRIVHDFADGRTCVGRYLNKIKPGIFCCGKSSRKGQHS